MAALGLLLLAAGPAAARNYPGATTSSPISLSADGRYLWSVNPGADNVSVIYTRTNRVIRKIKVGDEPESVAVDPNNRYAYVANAGSGSVTVIRITRARGKTLRARTDRRAGRRGQIATGSEPWNVVVSPNGRRVFVANSGQDTITVIDGTRPRRRGGVIGHVNLKSSRCNDPDRTRHFQPRGIAVSKNNRRVLVSSFFSWVRPGGQQGTDTGREGVVCRLNVSSRSKRIRSYRVRSKVAIGPQVTGFTVDATGDGVPDPTSAFPNQMQSIVIRGNQAYLPNIAASPTGPLRFNVDTQAFVNVLDGASSGSTRDASAAKFANLHLGARQPEAGKKKLFFANVWGIAFTKRSGSGNAYVISSGSDLVVKMNVDGSGKLTNTVDADTTRYIDLNDPANPATQGGNAGKFPQGIAINRQGTRAYVSNFVSRNISVIDLTQDRVIKVIRTAPLPGPGTPEEVVTVGAEIFFSSRGIFNRPAGTTVSTTERLSSEGWQSCSSCHFEGLTDSIVWQFGVGPRKSVPLNATFNPNNPADQRVLNYSAIFDEVEDFEANIRNVSGPGALAAALPCTLPPPATSTLDPNHGLLIGDDGNFNVAPCVLNAFAKANAGRAQHTVTLPGSGTQVPALTALREWVKLAVRTPKGPSKSSRLPNRLTSRQISQGRTLFTQAGCAGCHVGGKWTIATKDFASPPAGTEIFTETTPPATFGAPIGAQYLNRFLRDIGSFNLGVRGGPNPLGANVGAIEKASGAINAAGVAGPAPDALGQDYNGDGRGIGYNVPSLLGIDASPPFYHNGACESLACVVGNVKHRTQNGRQPDRLPNARDRALVVKFLQSIDARTKP
ncbi:MAG TPA: YncE family protein [Solirubrobacterales bacterium]|nr:YncE family protein [Solirubrobacterales bacterium]